MIGGSNGVSERSRRLHKKARERVIFGQPREIRSGSSVDLNCFFGVGNCDLFGFLPAASCCAVAQKMSSYSSLFFRITDVRFQCDTEVCLSPIQQPMSRKPLFECNTPHPFLLCFSQPHLSLSFPCNSAGLSIRHSSSHGTGTQLPAPAHGTDNTLAPSTSSGSKFASTSGIIFPPPELRRTIDKAAELIAKKDPSFEANIKKAEQNNSKFAFLKEDDAYHAYYASRRDAVRRGETLTPAAADQADAASAAGGRAGSSAVASADAEAGPSRQAPPEPEPFEFSADLPNITAVDLDILKLTALFTARKGRSFTTSLLARESKSYQFEFLRPSHSLFTYFNHLVEQYQKVISPTPALLDRVKLGAYGTTDPDSVEQQRARPNGSLGAGKGGARPQLLEQVKARAEWEKYTREKRMKQDEDQEKQRQAFNEIDWQDFVVVGTVELTEADQHIDLPPPKSLREMETMTLAQKKMASMIMESEAAGEDIEDVEEMAMPGRPGASNVPAVEEVPRPDGKGGTIKVRRDYVPRGLASRAKPSTSSATTKCPVCGDQVAIDEMAEHVRFELLNPAYREQRQQLESKKAQQAALQAGADPTYYLKQLASARDDEDEEARLRREAEEKRLAKEKEKIIWDGHAKSRPRGKRDARQECGPGAGDEQGDGQTSPGAA